MDRVDVLVIGGGILGAGVAYYLAQEGVSDVLVVEASLRGSGATGGSMGNVRQQGFGTELEIECSRRGLAFWKSVEDTFGLPCPFHEDGFLMLTGNDDSVRVFEAQAELQRKMGMPDVAILEPSEVVDILPFVNPAGLICGSYTPHDGHVMAMDGLAAYLHAGRERGVRIREHWPVDSVERGDGVWVAHGPTDVAAKQVVMAAGAGTPKLVAPFGITMDIRAVPHRNLLTGPAFPGHRIPTTIDIDSGLTVEREGESLILAMTGRNPAPRDDDHLVELFFDAAAKRAPALVDLSVIKHLTHYVQVGGDDMPYVGLVDEDLWAVAFTGHGVMHGPAVAEAVAKQIVGRPDDTLDMSMWDIRREPGKPTVLWRRNRED